MGPARGPHSIASSSCVGGPNASRCTPVANWLLSNSASVSDLSPLLLAVEIGSDSEMTKRRLPCFYYTFRHFREFVAVVVSESRRNCSFMKGPGRVMCGASRTHLKWLSAVHSHSGSLSLLRRRRRQWWGLLIGWRHQQVMRGESQSQSQPLSERWRRRRAAKRKDNQIGCARVWVCSSRREWATNLERKK